MMKKETVILIVVIAFIVGFIAGATVVILRGEKGAERAAMVQKPEMAPIPGPPKPSSLEVASKIKTLNEILQRDPKNLPAWVELGNLYFDKRPRAI
jgi:hypothetical protein